MKKQLLILSAAAIAASGINAQQLRGPESETDTRKCYITWPSSYSLDQYVNDWTPGQALTKTYGARRAESADAWEDEEFFTSRVKLRPLISNVKTQIFEEYVGDLDKKLVFWVPCGMVSGYFQTGSLPNGVFDSEVFSAWSYVTHYGNWSSPFGWVPGGFADAAHKHGVLVSGLASIPTGYLGSEWQKCLLGMGEFGQTEEGVAKLGDFLRYHGVDGLGYNSEFRDQAGVVPRLRTLHGALVKYMAPRQSAFENLWYGITNDNGSTQDGSYLAPVFYQNFGYSDEPRTVMFLNYNWNRSTYLSTTEAGVEATGRDPHDVYMGMNMQGGCKTATEWVAHATGGAKKFSIGLWGEHSKNMLFPARVKNGGSDVLKQEGYQKILEQFFTNGLRNPAAKMEIQQSRSTDPSDEFHGMSRLMNARSAYGWDLDEEPFITYFSLGNGPVYKHAGEVAYPNPWYNIGMQDYTPTWRFWWANELLGKEPENVPANSMNASYSWDDAWQGGSSLKISGSTMDPQYLHLFKTDFRVKNGDDITVRYKILKGDGDISFLYSKVGRETTEQTPERTFVHKVGEQFFYDEWYVKSFKVATRGSSALSSGNWALMGLKVANADNLEVLIGEISVVRGTAETPAQPVIRKGEILSDVVEGVDAKIIFSMDNNKAAGEPVYNTDVKTSHFNLYAQIEGEEEQYMGSTTSWAGLMFKIQNPNHKKKCRLGVQAVSLDHKSASDIAWTEDYLDIPDHEVSEEVRIDKACIKPGEEFRIWFIDDLHENSTLTLYSTTGDKVASNDGASTELVASLNEVGAYDLVANEGTDKEKRYTCFAQISDFSVGRVPEIESLTINGEDASGSAVTFSMNTEIKAGYTGRTANGEGSRAIRNDFKTFGGPVKEMQLGQNQSFSVGYRVRITSMPADIYGEKKENINLFGIEDRTGSWPENNWGFFWSHLESNGHVNPIVKRGNSFYSSSLMYFYPETTIVAPGAWTHVVHVFDYDASGELLMKLYINGVYQVPSKTGMDWDSASASNVKDGIPDRCPNRSLMSETMWMHILGGRSSEPAYPDAILDDVVVWDGVASDEDILAAMKGFDADNLPANVKCFWNFEDEPVDGVSETWNGSEYTHNGRFISKGQITDATFGRFDLISAENEGQNKQTHLPAIYDAGCPYVKGSAYKVETTPEWSTRQATVTVNSGTDTEGEATVVYGAEGDKTLSLTLTNSWGSDSKDYPLFTIGAAAIDGIAADGEDVEAYTVNKTLFLEFAQEGDYEVNVYSMSGVLAGRDARAISAGEVMSIALGQTGVYVVSVTRNGKVVRTIKVVNQ